MRAFTVIAHRGASGYLPEHTLEATAMAHAMGAHCIEQDAVLTADGQLIVLHDLYLDAVTDVARRFPGRARPDGKHYALDFRLDELRSLRVHERLGERGEPALPGRFTPGNHLFRVPTLDEAIELILGLNRSTGRAVGLYIEPKAPAWHVEQGVDIVGAVLSTLARHGLEARNDQVYLQSFDLQALWRARHELHSDLKLVQLIGENSWAESPTDFDYLRTEAGLREVAAFAQGIGPFLPQVVDLKEDGLSDISDFARVAQRLGLFVHAYTLRADQLPPAIGSMKEAVRILAGQTGIDGVFTDHPDQVIRHLPDLQQSES